MEYFMGNLSKEKYILKLERKIRNLIANGSSPSNVAEYACNCARSQKYRAEAIYGSVASINPLIEQKARLLSRSMDASSITKKRDAVEASKQAAEYAALKKTSILRDYETAKSKGLDIRWGASLAVTERTEYFNKDEIKSIIEIRKVGLSTYSARQYIGCTLAEINRWDAEGLLPHAFKKRIQAGGKMTDTRFWLAADLDVAMPHIESWRTSHSLKKSFKRKKSPLKAVT
jgi:hypothetical protein